MRGNLTSQSGFLNLRVGVAFLLCLGGVSTAVFGFAVSAPSRGTTNSVHSPRSIAPKELSATPPVTVTEFSDFRCPYCQRAATVVEQLREIYGNNVRFVFKQMPLPFHQYAFKAAQAAVIADQQGKFWEYHDRLFAARDLSVDTLKKMAAEVGLKQEEFSKSLDSAATRAVVERDIDEARQLGVRGTPTFFVNGEPVRGAATLPTLTCAIDHALGKAAVGEQPLEAISDNSNCGESGSTAQANLPTLINVAFIQQTQAATATRTIGGVTLSPPSLNFGYQLVGTAGAPMAETVTNSGNTSLVITDISVSGRDRRDFIPSYGFTLPVTIAASGSVTINLTFQPLAPWRAGTRTARMEISEGRSSQYVPLTGIGATCGGPVPACSSGCPDTDGDGLNDAWEIAGGIDINNDGVVDAINDVLLPGADPNRPDIYLKYDYMVSATHSYQPPANAWDQMIAMFAAHGITLHVVAPTAGIPFHEVTTLDPNATSACAGTDFITTQQLRASYFGNLRYAYHYMVFAHDSTTPHSGALVSNCPRDPLCNGLPTAGASGVSDLPGDDSIISFGAEVDAGDQVGIESFAGTMMHELGHNFGLVHGSLADEGGSCSTNSDCVAPFNECFNGKCINSFNQCLIKKPNYISVMNYSYQLSSISPATAPGTITPISCTTDADCGPPTINSGRCATPNSCFCTDDGGPGNNFCYRPDYAEDNLLNLNETTLDENVGVGGPADDDDIVFYWNGNPASAFPGASNGSPIDFNNDGTIENVTGCITTLGPDFSLPFCPDIDANYIDTDQMDTTADWTQVNGKFIHFNFQFQCTAGFRNDVPSSPASPRAQPATVTASTSYEPNELSFEWARQHHLLHPPRLVSISVNPGYSSNVKLVIAGHLGTVRVAVLGAKNLDVTQIEPSSLDFHGSKAVNFSVQDINGDGKLDLVATFDTSTVRLHPKASVARLTGWLKNGQSFIGEDKVTVASSAQHN